MREKSIGVDCDEQCLNRAQSIECTNENCGVNGGTCNNRIPVEQAPPGAADGHCAMIARPASFSARGTAANWQLAAPEINSLCCV